MTKKEQKKLERLMQFKVVRLKTNDYASLGVPFGSKGTILDVYGNDDYEVEFCNKIGETLLFQSFNIKDLELVD